MRNPKRFKTRAKIFLRRVLMIVTEEYLKELFMFLHMLICKTSPEVFAFGMIVIIAIFIAWLED